MGYAGNDLSIFKILQELSVYDQPCFPLQIYWFDLERPNDTLATLLEKLNAIWVNQRKYDSFVLLVINEFDLIFCRTRID